MKINIYHFILFIVTTTIMLIANLMSTNLIINGNNIENKWVILFIYTLITYLFVLLYKPRLEISKQKMLFLILWELFMLSIFTSKYLHGNFNILEFILYSILIPLGLFSKITENFKNIILISFLFSILPFLYILDQKNILGMLFCMGGILLLILLMKSNHQNYIYLIIILISLLIFITNSRTSLITFLIISGIQLFVMFFKESTSFLSLIRKMGVFIGVILVIYLSWDKFNKLLFNKFENTNSDITSGRIGFWYDLINNRVKMFGNDLDYFSLYNVRDAHNTIIQLLIDYGTISLFLFFLIIIFIVMKMFTLRKLEFVLFFSGYFLLGMTENLLFIDNRLITFHILFFFYLGYIVNYKSGEKYIY